MTKRKAPASKPKSKPACQVKSSHKPKEKTKTSKLLSKLNEEKTVTSKKPLLQAKPSGNTTDSSPAYVFNGSHSTETCPFPALTLPVSCPVKNLDSELLSSLKAKVNTNKSSKSNELETTKLAKTANARVNKTDVSPALGRISCLATDKIREVALSNESNNKPSPKKSAEPLIEVGNLIPTVDEQTSVPQETCSSSISNISQLKDKENCEPRSKTSGYCHYFGNRNDCGKRQSSSPHGYFPS
ncbi:hypothetical protein FOCC_FOCC015601, partial [Frankliniella occidentalis]